MTALFLPSPRSDLIHDRRKREQMHEELRTYIDKQDTRQARHREESTAFRQQGN
jgi:hypothetical protein